MKIANYTLHSIETGNFSLDGGALFGTVPKPLWEKQLQADSLNRINLALRCLLIKSENKNILIDCGIGNKLSEKEKNIYSVNHSVNNIEKSLEKLRLTKADITHVILTHLHFDHAGGATELDDKGNLNISFPNAIYYIQRKQLNWVLMPSDRDKNSFIKNNFQPLLDENRIKILSGDIELFPNIQLIVVNGHTAGQQLVKISDKHKTLIYCGDLISTTSHLLPHWVMAFDNEPLVTVEEKKNILAKACNRDWILFFDHDPHIEACTIEAYEKGYKVKSIVTLTKIY